MGFTEIKQPVYIYSSGPTDPSWGVGGPPVDPSFGIPGVGGRPDQGLPGGGHPWLPGHLGGPRPDQGLPGGGHISTGPIYGGGYPSTGPIYGGGHPSHPITLPPLPGVWPPPGQPSLPIYIPPEPTNPITIPGTPTNPIAQPPGTIWPPLPPTSSGKYAVLILVVGLGYHWLVVEAPALPDQGLPPTPEPK